MRNKQRGFSLVEVSVVALMTVAIMTAVYQIMEHTVLTSNIVESRNDMQVFTQAAMNNLQSEIFQAKEIFDNTSTAIGPGYRSALTLPAAYPLMTNSQMPIIDTTGQFVPDGGTAALPGCLAVIDPVTNLETTPATCRFVGNSLLIARQLAPVKITLSAGLVATIDLYKFEFFYLAKNTSRQFSPPTVPYYLDIVGSSSATYADFTEITATEFNAAQATTICATLRTLPNTIVGLDKWKGTIGPVLKAWNPQQPIGSAIYNIPASVATGGATALGSPVANPTIDLTNSASLIPQMVGGRMSSRMEYSVAVQTAAVTAGNFSPVRDKVPAYAFPDASIPNYPGGFEVLVIGTSGNRQVLTRLVLYARLNVKDIASRSASTITASSAS